MINITKGTDHVLLLTLTRGSAPLPLSESSEVVVKARNTYGAQTVLNRRFSTDHEGAMEADWPYTLPVGAYTLEVTGLLEGEGRWRASGQLVQVTTDTDHGTESETIHADTYDVTIAVSVRPGREGVDEELRQKIADMIDEEYNASEAVREAAEQLRVETEQSRVNAEALRVQAESLRVQAETARDNAETLRAQAEQDRSDAETLRATAEQTRQQNETARTDTFKADHTQATTDHGHAAADHTRAESDHATAAADHTRAESDHAAAAADHTRAESDHAAAAADHTQASTDHAASTEATTKASNVNVSISGTVVTITDKNGVQTSIDIGFDIHKTYASVSAMNADAANVADGKFVMIATTDSTSVENARLYVRNSNAASSAEPFTFICDLDQAASSAWADWFNNYKPTIESDHTRAESDHTQASTDHDTAAADHTQASTDHDTAAADHTQAGTDHDTAAADHAQADTDHAASTGATGAANAAASLANTAAQAADTAREQLMAKEVTMNDFDEILPPPTGVDPDYEVVKVVLTDDIGGLNLQGLPVAIYLNGSETASETKTADANGCIVFTLPVGTHYRLAFTQVAGSEEIPDEEHTALLIWRAIECRYRQRYEQVEIVVKDRNEQGVLSALADCQVTLAVTGGTTMTLTTDSQGKATASIVYGSTYTVSVQSRPDHYVKGMETSRTFMAGSPSRLVEFEYRYFNPGLYFVLSDGTQMTREQFAAALDAGTKLPNDATYILIATPALIEADSCFAFSIDEMANRSYSNSTWINTSTLVTTIPANGNVVGADYYYDGLGACRAVKTFAESNGQTKNSYLPSFVLNEAYEIAGASHPAFLGSVGQWSVLWANRFQVDDMILLARPNATRLLSTFSANKWTCTQYGAFNAWYWSSSASFGSKNVSFAVVPFFAY